VSNKLDEGDYDLALTLEGWKRARDADRRRLGLDPVEDSESLRNLSVTEKGVDI
jgi:hypothetical protein